MRKIAVFVLLGLAVSMLAVSSASNVKAAGAAPHRISGALPGTITFVVLPLSDVDNPYFQVAGLGVVSGQLKSLGNSNVFTFHRPFPMESGPTLVKDGRFSIVAASGDRVNGMYEGNVMPGTEPDQLIATTNWVITGGTGRFENATGTIQATAHVTMPDDPYALEWLVTWVLDGTINY